VQPPARYYRPLGYRESRPSHSFDRYPERVKYSKVARWSFELHGMGSHRPQRTHCPDIGDHVDVTLPFLLRLQQVLVPVFCDRNQTEERSQRTSSSSFARSDESKFTACRSLFSICSRTNLMII
jgi:hypothetical protein